MPKKNIKKIKTIPYFDGGMLGNVAGQASKLIPKDTTLGGATSGALNGAMLGNSIVPGYGAIAGGLIGGITGGIQGANAQDQNQVSNLSNGIQDRNQILGFDDGGMLTYYNGGFEHNDPNPQNVNQGIPQGITPNGQNNVTERNETKGKIDPIKDYVFSNNPDMKITKDMLEGTNLPKTLAGKTYAQASKYLDKDTKERPYDKISKDSNAILLSQLRDLNENSIVQKDMSTFMKNGGNLMFDPGGPLSTAEQDSLVSIMNQQGNQYLQQDNRNLVQRLGDNFFSGYENNKPELLKMLGDFDPLSEGVKYVTGHSDPMYDSDGNLIQGGAAPMLGARYGNLGKQTLKGTNSSIIRNYEKQVLNKAPNAKKAFEKASQNFAQGIKRPIKEWNTNYDPLSGLKYDSEKAAASALKKETELAARKEAIRLENLGKARTAKEEKAYQKLLNESNNAKSGINIPKELEGTVKFSRNPITIPNINSNLVRNIGQDIGAAGIIGGLGYGASQIHKDPITGELVNTSTSNIDAVPNYTGNPINPNKKQEEPLLFQKELSTMIPDKKANTINNGTNNSKPKRWTVDNIYEYAKTPEDRIAALQNFARRNAGDWGDYAKSQGFEMGNNNVPKQDFTNASGKFDPNGRFAGGVTPEELKILYPNLVRQVAPDGNFTGTDEQLDAFQKAYALKNKMELDPNNSTYGKIGGDWLRGVDIDNPDGGGGEGGGTPTGGSTPPPEWKDFPIDEKKWINTPSREITTPGKEIPPNPNLWPEAGLLTALPYMGLKPNLADPTLMSTGYVKPQLVDEMSQRAGLNNAYSAGAGSMANYAGGNRGALMANLQGLSAGNMDATSNAFLQSNMANNQARQQADMFNIQNQTGVAGQNTNTLNRFELENKELINNINAKKADELSNTWGNYVENAYRRKDNKDTLNDRLNMIRQYTGYGGGNMTPSTTKVIPGSSLELPSTKLNVPEMNYTGIEQPQNVILQQDRTQLHNRLNKAMGNTNLLFNPNSVQSTINSKIKKPAGFCYGGHLNSVRRSLK